MNKFEEEYKDIMNYKHILLEKKLTVKDIPLLKKEEKEARSLLKVIDKIVKGMYPAQKELDYLDRNMKGLPMSKTKYTKAFGSWSSTAEKLYEKLTDYQQTLYDYILDIQEQLIDLEEEAKK